MIKNDTAILLFSRSATAEAAAKPLSTNPRSARSLASFLINRSKKMATKTDLPIFLFSEKQQRGATFGERFTNAFEDVFALGFDRVIAIGNDCLMVNTSDILRAEKALKTTPSVFGATTDGGAYLIGFQRIAFQKTVFQNLDWQTNDVFNQLVQCAQNQGQTSVFLSEKSDIDHPADWQKVLPRVAVFIQKIVARLLQISVSSASKKDVLPLNHRFLTTSFALRAPPVC
jgi:glycosyltransferase A (GT-A) superfamily protein (DUF2064 family)